MQKLLIAISLVSVLMLAGCGSDSKETAETTPQTDATKAIHRAYTDPTPADCIDDGSLIALKTGVRIMDMIEGHGHVFEDWDYIKYDYAVWFADTTGNHKRVAFYDSYASQQPYYGQIGDRMIAGLAQGLPGMKEGGCRRIFIPKGLGYPEGSPFGSGAMIFEIYDIQMSSALDVDEYRASYNSKDELKDREKKMDYVQQRRADSLRRAAEQQATDSSGQGN